jgi:hypothetical protein
MLRIATSSLRLQETWAVLCFTSVDNSIAMLRRLPAVQGPFIPISQLHLGGNNVDAKVKNGLAGFGVTNRYTIPGDVGFELVIGGCVVPAIPASENGQCALSSVSRITGCNDLAKQSE